MLFILAIVFLSAVSVIAYILNDPERKYRGKNVVPGPKGMPLIGLGLDFVAADPSIILDKLMDICREWSGLARFKLGFHNFILVSRPEDIEQIMTDKRFLQKSFDYAIMRPWLQEGLLTVGDATKWTQRRKTITPAFHFKILDDFVEVMDQQAKTMTKVLQKEATGKPFDMAKYVTLFTLDVICETSMGVTVNAQTDKESEYVKHIIEISGLIFWRLHHFLARDDWYWNFTSKRRRHDYLVEKIQSFTRSVIENRRQLKSKEDVNQNTENEFGIKKRRAFLDILLESTVNGAPLTNNDIQEEVDTFMFEGHDTTTSAIEFLLYNLAKYPEVQERVYNEVVEVLGTDINEPLTLSKLNDLNYLDLVLKETLRIFPSVPAIGRFIKEDIDVNGHLYPANHNIILGIYMMQRDPKIFPDPMAFKPERFLEQKNHEKMNAFSYVPFAAGYRNCIGQKFAQYEVKTVISRILQKYVVKQGPASFTPKVGIEMILRPMNGMILSLEERRS